MYTSSGNIRDILTCPFLGHGGFCKVVGCDVIQQRNGRRKHQNKNRKYKTTKITSTKVKTTQIKGSQECTFGEKPVHNLP